ncbi:MAG: universal stress protein [Pseudomonadota bacterium]
MAIGAVLVPAFDVKGVGHAVKAALPFVDAFGAQLIVAHVRERYPSGYVAEYYWHTSVVNEFEDGRKRRAEDIKTAAVEAIGSRESSWIEPEGSEETTYGVVARTADVIVAPPPGVCDTTYAESLLQSILVGSGRPVFIAPEGAAPAITKSYLVGWNGSVEAGRAIAVARPLLEAAEKVTIVSVGDVEGAAADAAGVADALAKSGVNAVGLNAEKRGSVTETLQAVAGDFGADALLLGGYSHSRLRERVLGGVTRRVIEKPPMPVILVH